MSNDFTYVGNGAEEISWMDFRDMIITGLHNVDTELKFNKVLMGILLSICPTPEQLIETRKTIGMKVSKEDEDKIRKMYKDENKKY